MDAAIHRNVHDFHHPLVDFLLFGMMVIRILIVKNSAQLFQSRTNQSGNFCSLLHSLQQNSSAKYFVLNRKWCILM